MKLKAIKPLRYANASIVVGGEFDASEKDAKLLRAIGKAIYISDGLGRKPDPSSVPAEKIEMPAEVENLEGNDFGEGAPGPEPRRSGRPRKA